MQDLASVPEGEPVRRRKGMSTSTVDAPVVAPSSRSSSFRREFIPPPEIYVDLTGSVGLTSEDDQSFDTECHIPAIQADSQNNYVTPTKIELIEVYPRSEDKSGTPAEINFMENPLFDTTQPQEDTAARTDGEEGLFELSDSISYDPYSYLPQVKSPTGTVPIQSNPMHRHRHPLANANSIDAPIKQTETNSPLFIDVSSNSPSYGYNGLTPETGTSTDAGGMRTAASSGSVRFYGVSASTPPAQVNMDQSHPNSTINNNNPTNSNATNSSAAYHSQSASTATTTRIAQRTYVIDVGVTQPEQPHEHQEQEQQGAYVYEEAGSYTNHADSGTNAYAAGESEYKDYYYNEAEGIYYQLYSDGNYYPYYGPEDQQAYDQQDQYTTEQQTYDSQEYEPQSSSVQAKDATQRDVNDETYVYPQESTDKEAVEGSAEVEYTAEEMVAYYAYYYPDYDPNAVVVEDQVQPQDPLPQEELSSQQMQGDQQQQDDQPQHIDQVYRPEDDASRYGYVNHDSQVYEHQIQYEHEPDQQQIDAEETNNAEHIVDAPYPLHDQPHQQYVEYKPEDNEEDMAVEEVAPEDVVEVEPEGEVDVEDEERKSRRHLEIWEKFFANAFKRQEALQEQRQQAELLRREQVQQDQQNFKQQLRQIVHGSERGSGRGGSTGGGDKRSKRPSNANGSNANSVTSVYYNNR